MKRFILFCQYERVLEKEREKEEEETITTVHVYRLVYFNEEIIY